MLSSSKGVVFFAGISGILMVSAGAFGAHALKEVLESSAMGVYQTATQYHFYHTLVLLVCGVWLRNLEVAVVGNGTNCRAKSHRLVLVAAKLFLSGIVLFSGSLYMLAFGFSRWLGVVTPFGGLCFIAGWLLIALAALKLDVKKNDET